ncbi:MAG: flippase-like domain-containing protein [Nitrospirae bacterium]|nr:flippase-like domain-containing protein [Nitrospirota bacterium]
MLRKTLRIFITLSVIVLIGYFYFLEFRKNWDSLQNFSFVVKRYCLLFSLFLYLLSYLLETFTWKVCINTHLGRKELNFFQSIAVVNASGLFKYLPGRIWTYTAQLVWLKKYRISKPVVLYVNLICIAGSVMVSSYLGLFYLAFYTNIISTTAILLLSAALVAFNIAYIVWNSWLMNRVIAVAGRLFKREIQPVGGSKSLIVFIQFMYACSWAFMGFGGYFLAKGIGLPLLFSSVLGLLASMSLSWMAGYFAVVSPGGLGIREGLMLLMLNNIVSVQTALLFPILSRFMYLIAEALLGLAALVFGIKYKVFVSEKVPAE